LRSSLFPTEVYSNLFAGIFANDISTINKNIFQKTKQEILTIDMFTFDMEIRPEVLAGAPSPDVVICEDFSQKMEDVPISVVNAVDKAQMPSMVYRARRMADVDDENIEVSIGQNFCTGCSCTGLFSQVFIAFSHY
jgi:hypothetical protein